LFGSFQTINYKTQENKKAIDSDYYLLTKNKKLQVVLDKSIAKLTAVN